LPVMASGAGRAGDEGRQQGRDHVDALLRLRPQDAAGKGGWPALLRVQMQQQLAPHVRIVELAQQVLERAELRRLAGSSCDSEGLEKPMRITKLLDCNA